MEHEPCNAGTVRALTDYYQGSEDYKQHLTEKDASYFRQYVAVLSEMAGRVQAVLDIGCGTGQSTHELRNAGLRAIGCDLSPLFLAGQNARQFVAADAARLPFPDSSFVVVGAHEFIEHVPDVPRVLEELWRVTKPGGVLVINSPNLLSPLVVIRDLPAMLLRRQFRPPLYSTFLQAFRFLFSSFARCVQKALAQSPRFLYRTPDLGRAGNGGDFDAVYCSHPRDLSVFLRARGAAVEYAKPPRGLSDRDSAVMSLRRLLGPLWMNFFLIARKPKTLL